MMSEDTQDREMYLIESSLTQKDARAFETKDSEVEVLEEKTNQLNLMLTSLPGTTASTATSSSMSSASSLASPVPPAELMPSAQMMHELDLLENVCVESLATFNKLATNGFDLCFFG